MDRKAMIQVAGSYIPGIVPTENAAYMEAVREIRGTWQDDLSKEMTAIRTAATLLSDRETS